MPFPTPLKGESKQEFISRCMVTDEMEKEFPEEDQRYSVCVKQWKKRPRSLACIKSCIKVEMSKLVHEDTFKDKKFTVIPMVLMNEGIHNDILFPATELSKFPDSWNYRPVVLNHPRDEDGEAISANSTDVLEACQLGFLFNTVWEVDGVKLKTECWLDPDLLKSVAGAAAIVAMLKKNQMIEGSIGVFTDDIMNSGVFADEKFEGTAYNYAPDHYALLPNDEGACSVEDGGGGPRINKKEDKRSLLQRIRAMLPGDLGLKDEESSHGLIRQSLSNVLRANFKDQYPYIQDVFDTDVVFEVTVAGSEKFMKQTYSRTDDAVKLIGDPKEVKREVKYVEVKPESGSTLVTNGENKMTVAELIANESTKFTKDDEQWLSALEADQLDKLIPVEKKEVKVEKKIEKTEDIRTEKKEEAPAVLKVEDIAAIVIATLKAESEKTEEGKAETVRVSLKDNEDCPYTEDELKQLPYKMLLPLQASLGIVVEDADYSGRGGQRNLTTDSKVEDMPALVLATAKEDD